MRFRAVVHIERKPGLSDPEGTTARRALRDLGFEEVGSVSFGRTITLDLDASSREDAAGRVDEMCRKLLANPVIERYTIEIAP